MDGDSAVPDQNVETSLVKSMGHVTNVYIWDMDETLILLKSLLYGTYAEAFKGLKDVAKGVKIGKLWEDHILRLCDDLFFYEQVCLSFSLDLNIVELYLGSCYKSG